MIPDDIGVRKGKSVRRHDSRHLLRINPDGFGGPGGPAFFLNSTLPEGHVERHHDGKSEHGAHRGGVRILVEL